jgi:hypothetical protein
MAVDFAWSKLDGRGEKRAVEDKGMVLAALATWVHFGRERG